MNSATAATSATFAARMAIDPRYLNNAIASSVSTPPVIEIGANGALAAIGKMANEAAPIGKPDVGTIALTGHGHDLLFGRPIGRRQARESTNDTGYTSSRSADNFGFVTATLLTDLHGKPRAPRGPSGIRICLGQTDTASKKIRWY